MRITQTCSQSDRCFLRMSISTSSAWSPVSIGKPAPKIHQWTIYFCRWGFGWVDKAQCFRSARRFGAAGSSPDFSRGFSDMALLGLCLEPSFNYSTVVPGPTFLLLLFLFSSSGHCLKNVATDFFIPFQRLVAMKQSQGMLKNTCFARFEIFRKVNLRTLKFCGNFCR